MSFLINASEADDWSGTAFKAYRDHLESIKSHLPKAVYDFAVADWHYDGSKKESPHDAWIQEIKIKEIAEGETRISQIRTTQIEIILLGAYHDRLFKVTYEDVSSYFISSWQSSRGHGDWVIDEIGLSDAGLVTHEIKFWHDVFFKIECRNIIFQEQLTSTPYETIWMEKAE
jgi:hypothetical protein